MGNKITVLTETQIEDYQDCTFFTRKEILRVFKKYRDTCPERIPKDINGDSLMNVKVPLANVEELPELKVKRRIEEEGYPFVIMNVKEAGGTSVVHSYQQPFVGEKSVPMPCAIFFFFFKENPFRRRICQVFSSDGKGDLTFEDFLDLLSVFSEQTPRDIKVFYAFKIYDFDGDRYIGPADLEQAARLLTRNELTSEEITQIAEKVIEEADVDGDGKLSYMEFEHVILRAPDFLATFHIRI